MTASIAVVALDSLERRCAARRSIIVCAAKPRCRSRVETTRHASDNRLAKDPDGFLAWTVLRGNGSNIPEYLVCGGLLLDYTHDCQHFRRSMIVPIQRLVSRDAISAQVN